MSLLEPFGASLELLSIVKVYLLLLLEPFEAYLELFSIVKVYLNVT